MVLDLGISSPGRVLRAATFGNGVYERELPALNVFDYRALSLNSPADGKVILLGSTISSISASFNDVGAQLPPDSFNVKYRILNGATEVYSSTKTISSLGLKETRQVTFTGSFTPPDSGVYTLEAINLAADQNTHNDTTYGTLTIIHQPSITYTNVIKEACTYTEITGATVANNGDDVQTTIGLPFTFQFDNYPYDSVQVSTNGWLEFGTGTEGSVRGISNPGQIGPYGANPNGTLFSTAHPTKALGVWWEDMVVDGSASLTYKTLNSAPNRIFVVQWKNVLAYYDNTTTTTRINFQIRLNETSNTVDFSYGPVAAGTMSSGGDVGAMIGIKDHIGGDYHFYDFILGGTGAASDGITNLSPLSNWPGPDSCYHFGPPSSPTSVSIQVSRRWNLVSVPLLRTDYSVTSIFPTAVSGTTYLYNGGYVQRDSMIPGKGYWTKFPGALSQSISGTPLDTVGIPVTAGWNLIGTVDHDIPAPSGGIVTSNFYGYSDGYKIADTLKKGHGYWVKTSGSGSIDLGPGALPRTSATVGGYSDIVISDNLGNNQTLYLAEDKDGKIDLARFEMPPSGPAAAFDARFASQRILEAYPTSIKNSISYPVVVSNAQYPIRISIDVNNGNQKHFTIDEVQSGKIVASHVLSGSQSVFISEKNGSSLVLTISEGSPIPTAYALRQNYPNPFNPTTTISFDLPENVFVNLKIYDITGREVKSLIEGRYEAGRYSVNVDFSNYASGIYFYRLTAGKYSDLKKMVLVK